VSWIFMPEYKNYTYICTYSLLQFFLIHILFCFFFKCLTTRIIRKILWLLRVFIQELYVKLRMYTRIIRRISWLLRVCIQELYVQLRMYTRIIRTFVWLLRVCVILSTHVHVNIPPHTNVCTHRHTCTQAHTYTHVHTHVHTHTRAHSYTHTHEHLCMVPVSSSVYLSLFIHSYIDI